jgi:hypothetical protein
MVISLGPQRDRPRRHLRGGSRLPASASHLLAADSEIAAGRIALFTPTVTRRSGLCCSRVVSHTPIWTVDARSPARLPGFHRAPVLCAARTFLWRRNASDHPCPPHASVVNVRDAVGRRGEGCRGDRGLRLPRHPATQRPRHPRRPRCRRGDLNSHEVTLTTP